VPRAFVIDSNFFISVSRTRFEGALEDLINWSKESGAGLHTGVRVCEEIRTVPNYGTKATMVELVERHFKVHNVAAEKIIALQRLIGVSAAPQDTDLSLMALCAELTAQGNQTTLVTDDFKITKTAPKIPQHFEVISPSVFLLQVSNESEGNRRARMRDAHRKVRRFEIEYMLARRDIYDAQPKLDWLIDSMIGSLSTAANQAVAPPPERAPVPQVPDSAPGEELDDVQALDYPDAALSGVMQFGATGTGSIGAVSVGIAEALIETALGLFVAIPAVWFYNYLSNRLEYFNVEMDNSSSELVDYFIKKTAAA